jgi:hypothetical protein
MARKGLRISPLLQRRLDFELFELDASRLVLRSQAHYFRESGSPRRLAIGDSPYLHELTRPQRRSV